MSGSTEDEARESAAQYRALLDSMLEGFAYCRVLCDDQGRPDDFVYLNVNPAFYRLTGLPDAVGKRATELMPTIKEESPELLEIYGRVAGTGEPAEFDIDFTPIGKRLHVSATRPREGEFVAFFSDVTARVQAERKARESEEHLRLSLAAACAGTWEWDLVSNENTWSDELWDLYGFDRDGGTATYDAWLESVAPEDRASVQDGLSAAVAEGRELSFEWRVKTRDGPARWLLSRGSPERDAAGEIVRYRGVVVDVTERRLALEALREREQSYSAIFNESPFAILVSRMPGGSIVSVNTAFGELFECTPEEVLGRTIPEVGIASEAAIAAMAVELTEHGAVRDREVERRTVAGRSLTLSINLTRVRIGGEDHVLTVIRDITDAKLAEEALQGSRAKLDAALASMTDAVFISDAEGGFVNVNEAFATFHRFATREECLWSLAEYPDVLEVYLASGEPAPLDQWAVPRALRGEVAVDAEYELRRKDTGETWTGAYSFAPIRDEAGQIVGSVVVARDVSDRKKAERDLLESEERLRSLFEHSPIGVFFGAPDGSVTAANPAACGMLGHTEAEMTDPPLSFVMMRDITERREMERALRQSEAEARETVARLSRAQQFGRMGDWEWDLASGEVRWSEELYRIYGVGPEFVTSFDNIVPFIHAEDREAGLRATQAFLDDVDRSSATLTFRIVRPGGAVRHIFQTLAVDRTPEGEPTRAFGIMQDVTEVREAEEARLQSDRRFRRFYDAGLVGVAFWSTDGRITGANERFLEMLGYTREELGQGRIDWVAMTPPEYRKRDAASLDELMASGRNAVPFEKEYYHKSGQRLPVLVAGAMLDDEKTEGIVLVVDLSEQKQAEEGLRRLNFELEERVRRRTADLEAANKELESFSYSVSHDLRAPLRHIAGFAELLREAVGDQGGEEVQHFVDVITRSAGDMGILIDDLLQFSRVGRAEMHVEPTDMERLVREVLDVAGSDCGDRRVEVAVGEILPATGDHTLLRQVWANLIDNAYKYTQPRDPAVIEVGSRRDDGELVYWVCDNGVGFDLQYTDRLFHVFERLHRSDEFEGAGIGLANVQRIVGRHGGRCWAEAEEGKGATFFFSLPTGGTAHGREPASHTPR